MRVLDLFSGIGGFSLGLERAGFTTAAFCEIDPFARRVLAKHWPGVPCYDDVRALTADRLAADGIAGLDVVCGGFPCQDISAAGRGAGLAGERSGLWFEFLRLVGEIRPRWVIIENVSALRSRGLEQVLGGLSALGYDAEWHCISAAAVGAPHRRDRVWVVGYPNGDDGGAWGPGRPDPTGAGQHQPEWAFQGLADAGGAGLSVSERAAILGTGWRGEGAAASGGGWWAAEPDVGRVAYGVPKRVDRLRSLGNAVVPQIPEAIGRAITRAAA